MISLVNGRERSSSISNSHRLSFLHRLRRLARRLRLLVLAATRNAAALFGPLELVQEVAPHRRPLSREEWDHSRTHSRGGAPPF
jgi:hypothetical protein